jgi:hypothetical protein
MKGNIIRNAVDDIEECSAALDWLLAYGSSLSGRSDDDNASVTVHLNFASSCSGSKQAAAMLSDYARSMLPEIVEATVRGCKNTIEVRREQILKEVGA